MPTVRRFQPADMVQVLDLLAALREETVWAKVAFTFDRDHAATWIMSELASPTFALYVADEAGTLVGLCGVCLTTQPLIPQIPFVTEWAWYVQRPYRDTRLGAQLWRAICKWGRDAGARGSYGATTWQRWPDEGRYHFWGVAHG